METKSLSVEALIEKLQQSEKDKVELSESIQELNDCYSSKIEILHATIQAYECRIEVLLEGRKEQIDRELSSTQRYEDENKKLIKIIDQLYLAFDGEKQTLESIIKEKEEQIVRITEEKQELLSKSQEKELTIDNLVRDHMIEIDELKRELNILKDDFIDGSIDESTVPHEINTEHQRTLLIEDNCETQDSLAQSHPLKEINISNRKQSSEIFETKGKQLVYRSPDPNFHALKAFN